MDHQHDLVQFGILSALFTQIEGPFWTCEESADSIFRFAISRVLVRIELTKTCPRVALDEIRLNTSSEPITHLEWWRGKKWVFDQLGPNVLTTYKRFTWSSTLIIASLGNKVISLAKSILEVCFAAGKSRGWYPSSPCIRPLKLQRKIVSTLGSVRQKSRLTQLTSHHSDIVKTNWARFWVHNGCGTRVICGFALLLLSKCVFQTRKTRNLLRPNTAT